MSLRAMVWGKYTDHARGPLDRLILMQLGDQAKEDDHGGPVRYRADTSLAELAVLAVTDEAVVRACLDALAGREAIMPAPRGPGDAELVFHLAVDG
jgi:hypothetical protein